MARNSSEHIAAVRDAAERFWAAGSSPDLTIQREIAKADMRALGINVPHHEVT